jgi:hypothetical protein
LLAKDVVVAAKAVVVANVVVVHFASGFFHNLWSHYGKAIYPNNDGSKG